VFVEKDAIAGTIQPVTKEYDIALRVCRGYASVSFAGEIADEWARITKPIYAYYLGDFDPSGFDLERDLREKLSRYSGLYCYYGQTLEEDQAKARSDPDEAIRHRTNSIIIWSRLAVHQADFAGHDLIALPVKESDRRSRGFVERYGENCAEVDALPPSELRRRVEDAITAHIDQKRWAKLLMVEEKEKATLIDFCAGLGA
jgi:hypothetical protein